MDSQTARSTGQIWMNQDELGIELERALFESRLASRARSKQLILNQLLVAVVDAYASSFILPKYAVGVDVESPANTEPKALLWRSAPKFARLLFLCYQYLWHLQEKTWMNKFWCPVTAFSLKPQSHLPLIDFSEGGKNWAEWLLNSKSLVLSQYAGKPSEWEELSLSPPPRTALTCTNQNRPNLNI